MLPLNFNHLYYFYVVAKHGSLSRAARELMVSQSSISVQIKQFEASLGQSLFNRRKTGVELTEYGEAVYPFAEEIFHGADRIRGALEAIEHHIRGTISLGTVSSIGIYLLPELLKQFNEKYPEVKVALDIREQRELIDLVRGGRLDLAILVSNRNYPGLSAIPLRHNKLFLVAPPGHPLAGRARIHPRDLGAYPFIAYEEGMETRVLIDGLFKRMAVRIEYAMESSNVAAIKHMVLAGIGIAFLPESSVGDEIRRGAMVRLSVPSLTLAQEITLYQKTNRAVTPTKREFLTFLRESLTGQRDRRRGGVPSSRL